MSKPILIIQLRPEDDAADNEFEAILKYAELETAAVERLRIEQNGIPAGLDPRKYAAVIVGGSPFDVSKPWDEKSAIQLKIEQGFMHLFDIIVTKDLPFLGICSGNGLLGSYLGASITKLYGESISCIEVELTEEGKDDPLLSGFPDRINAFVGHKEACDELPEGATLLVKGQACPIQMFRIGQNIYSTQFHPELDAEGLSLRARIYQHHGYTPANELEKVLESISDAKAPYAQELLKRFVQRYTDLS